MLVQKFWISVVVVVVTLPDILSQSFDISQDIGDEWGMGMNGDQILPIHPWAHEWG